MARWFLLLLSGCSLGLTGPSADRPRYKPPTCDTSKGLVALDGVLAATMGVIALSLAGNDSEGEAVGPLIIGSVFAGSAIHGNNVVNECNREQLNYESELASRELPPSQPERPLVAAPGAQGIARQPAVSLPSASGPIVPQQLAPPRPPPPPSQQPPAPAPPEPANEAWAAFWKELP